MPSQLEASQVNGHAEPEQKKHRESSEARSSSSSGNSGASSPDLRQPCCPAQQARNRRPFCRAYCCPTSCRTSELRSRSRFRKRWPGSSHCRSGNWVHRVARKPTWRSNRRRCLCIVSMIDVKREYISTYQTSRWCQWQKRVPCQTARLQRPGRCKVLRRRRRLR